MIITPLKYDWILCLCECQRSTKNGMWGSRTLVGTSPLFCPTPDSVLCPISSYREAPALPPPPLSSSSTPFVSMNSPFIYSVGTNEAVQFDQVFDMTG